MMRTRSSPLFAEPLSCKEFNKKYLAPLLDGHARPLLPVKEVKGAEDWQEVVGVILCDYPLSLSGRHRDLPLQTAGVDG